MFGGRGAEEALVSATNASSSFDTAALKRRSKPIVVDALELI
jgi:hypothetical protein